MGAAVGSEMGGKGVSRPMDRRQRSEFGAVCFAGRICAAACRRCILLGRDDVGVSFFSFEFWRLPRRPLYSLPLSLPLSAPLTPLIPPTPSSPFLMVRARIFAMPRCVNVHHGGSSSDVSASVLSADESEVS